MQISAFCSPHWDATEREDSVSRCFEKCAVEAVSSACQVTSPAGSATATATARGFPHAEPRASASRLGAPPVRVRRSLPRACVSGSGMREPAAGAPHIYGGKPAAAEEMLSTHSRSRLRGGERLRPAGPLGNGLQPSVCARAPACARPCVHVHMCARVKCVHALALRAFPATRPGQGR